MSIFRIVEKVNGLGESSFYVQQRFNLLWFIPLWFYCKRVYGHKIWYPSKSRSEYWIEEKLSHIESLENKKIVKTIIHEIESLRTRRKK